MDVQECRRILLRRDAAAYGVRHKTENCACSGQRKGGMEEIIL